MTPYHFRYSTRINFIMSTINFTKKSTDDSSIVELQSMPCRIEHTGSAKVSTYMHREHINNETERTTFRGRSLEGSRLVMPVDYRLYVLRETASTNESKTMEIHANRRDFMMWNFDRNPSTKDTMRRAIDYLRIAEAFAADDN